MTTKITLPPMTHLEQGLYDEPKSYTAVDNVDCEIFLTKLRSCGVASIAAREVGRSEASFQRERRDNEAFSAAWDWALREAADLLVVEAKRRAMDGVDKPIFYKGDEVATVKEYSDSLLIKLLEGLHPEFKKNKDDDESSGRNATVADIHLHIIPAESFIKKEEVEEET